MAIALTDITTGETDGRGFYDELMRTSKDHLQQEYDAGRITGADYANVYLGMQQSNLSIAAQTVLQYELNNLQQLILDENKTNAAKQGLLLDAQIAQLQAQTALLNDELTNLRPEQLTQLQEQIDLLQSQDLGQIEQNKLITAQVDGQNAQNTLIGKQEDLVDEQIKTEAGNTDLTGITSGLVYEQDQKLKAENAILAQKLITEEAQTQGAVGTINGLIGAEIDLKVEQKESFVRDAEQKAAKFYADVFSIIYSTDPSGANANPVNWGLDGPSSTRVMSKVLTGINA